MGGQFAIPSEPVSKEGRQGNITRHKVNLRSELSNRTLNSHGMQLLCLPPAHGGMSRRRISLGRACCRPQGRPVHFRTPVVGHSRMDVIGDEIRVVPTWYWGDVGHVLFGIRTPTLGHQGGLLLRYVGFWKQRGKTDGFLGMKLMHCGNGELLDR